METSNQICPVCTLYLRPGITLKSHLTSHPKHKVIEALVRLSLGDDNNEIESQREQLNNQSQDSNDSDNINHTDVLVQPSWNQESQISATTAPSQLPQNHVFIYHQSMSASGATQSNVMNVRPATPRQQYVIPAMVNPQMLPYMYQQQQVIMSSSAYPPLMKVLPFETNLASSLETPSSSSCSTISSKNNIDEGGVIIKEVESSIDCDLDENKDEPSTSDKFEDINEKVKVIDIEIEEKINSPEHMSEDYIKEVIEPEEQPLDTQDWEEEITDTDLSKACQTPTSLIDLPSTSDNIANIEEINTSQEVYTTIDQGKKEYFCFNEPVGIVTYEDQPELVYTTTSSTIIQPNSHVDYVDMDNMHVIIGEFAPHPIISQVEDFDNRPDRGGVLMNIGDLDDGKNNFSQPDTDEGMSSGMGAHVNIRADERMPPRGELSGQESIGDASDIINWNHRMHCSESSSGMPYDLVARETWETDSSDIDHSNSFSRMPHDTAITASVNPDVEDADSPTIIGIIEPPRNFKCSICGEAFSCSQERKRHDLEKHPNKHKTNLIGSKVGARKVRKLVVKPKTENDGNNLDFTNKIKVEEQQPIVGGLEAVPTEEGGIKIDEVLSVDSRTVCTLCDSVFPNSLALKAHRLDVHKISHDSRFKCTTCDESFSTEYKFTAHLKIHPMECRLCGKFFYRRQNMQLHMKRHLGIKPYKCEVCVKSFLTKQKLEEHRNTHTGNAPIKCSLCDETFKRHSNLVQHRNRHHFKLKKKVKDFVCFCGEYFHSKKKLAWHKEVHDPKPKACTKCSEKFVHMSSLTRHMRKSHNERFLPREERNLENVECPICKGVYLRSSLEVHIRNHSGLRPYSCLICNKEFTTRWNLKLHKWTHASRVSKPFKCDQCKGAFIRESDYTAHMNSHKSIRPYTCNYCGAQFIRKYNCQRHVREHEQAKTFNCQVCGKSFHRSYYLKDHMRVHSGDRPFSCHVCGKSSTTKSNHNKHVQIHHAREPVSTEN